MEIWPIIVDMSWRWGIAQWFEWRWWKNYFAKKSKEEYLDWKKKYWQRILSLLPVKIQTADQIADIGCGPAGIFIFLVENSVTAVDPLLNKYESETSFFRRENYPRVSFIQSTIEEFHTDQRFDFVFCMNAINHIRDIEQGIQQLKGICSPKGTLVMSVDAHNHFVFKYLFRFLPADVLHPHQYDLREYKKMLRQDGWTISVPYLLEKGFFFNHYMLLCRRSLA